MTLWEFLDKHPIQGWGYFIFVWIGVLLSVIVLSRREPQYIVEEEEETETTMN